MESHGEGEPAGGRSIKLWQPSSRVDASSVRSGVASAVQRNGDRVSLCED